jgi:uncharacterized membrane protein YbhN (UPF0104 family)
VNKAPASLVLIVSTVCIAAVVLFAAAYNRTRKQPAGNGGGQVLAWITKHIRRFARTICSWRGAAAFGLTAASWLLEGTVVFGVMDAFGHPIGPLQAVWANSMTIIGQVLQVTPGGLGTYETTLTAALTLLGIPGRVSYMAALLSHGYKFLFAYISGGLALAAAAVTAAELRKWLRLKKIKND